MDRCETTLQDGCPVLKQTASRFEANFHVRGTDYSMKQPLVVQQGDEELLPD
jgi:hypothetical protein